LILSKAILRTGGLEALRAQINAAQNQKCFGLKDLPLAVRWRPCSRQGRASSPTVGERALPASQQIGNLGTWEVSRGAHKKGHTPNYHDQVTHPCSVVEIDFLARICAES